MEHIAALLLIVGCSNDLSQCRELPSPVTVFETAADCTSERPFALEGLRGRAARVMGECIPVDPALEEEYGEIVWKVHPDGTLEASVETSGMVMAANGQRPENDDIGRE